MRAHQNYCVELNRHYHYFGHHTHVWIRAMGASATSRDLHFIPGCAAQPTGLTVCCRFEQTWFSSHTILIKK
eukprot:SAG11_NODE_19667_length_461_cov_1.972376_1_plen_71_part_10